ncbi:MAG: malate dehydrogenase [Gammaproteobacteria bacterium]|nr:malate dehydrogenase [Gammaproteobacteria bacterium]MCD8542457.1 malate dehydrogenase [Gammaproteobacteria bacterium]
MTKPCITVTVSGAAGQISYALLFRIAAGDMFGPNCFIKLRLLDLDAAMPLLQAVVMELDDCAFPLLQDITITSDIKTAMDGANIVLLVGAVPRKQGMERSDLLKINGGIFVPQGAAINEMAASDVKVFVVGNPCNTNALIAMHAAPDVPKNRFYAMTALDENRAKRQLAYKANVDVSAISHMIIWGNHSQNQYPDFYNAKINGQAVTDVITDIRWLENEFVPMIQQRGATVINARGSSSAASAANAVVDGIRRLTLDTAAHDCFSVGRCSEGEYGVDAGLIFSMPCRTHHGQVDVLTDVVLNDFGHKKLTIVLEELRQEYAAVKALGLVE